MKIHILYNFKKGPWGGGNQFLRALKGELERQGVYEAAPEKADVVLFNSHHRLGDVLRLKSKDPEKVLLHRLGPVFHYHRGQTWKKYDKAIVELTNRISDGVVFQSQWAFEQAKGLGFNQNLAHKVIHNAVDSNIFNNNKQGKEGVKLLPFLAKQEKVKLAAMSWSRNPQKGFDFYQYLDQNLDFSKYKMTFVGNSPFEFKNIKMIKPLPSEKIAEVLKQNDIFIFAAQYEACSNALIEALSCGLPAVALDSGSNKELVREGGELFEGKEDVIAKIEKVTENYSHYQAGLPEFSIEGISKEYYSFAQAIHSQAGTPRKVGFREKILVCKIKLMSYVL